MLVSVEFITASPRDDEAIKVKPAGDPFCAVSWRMPAILTEIDVPSVSSSFSMRYGAAIRRIQASHTLELFFRPEHHRRHRQSLDQAKRVLARSNLQDPHVQALPQHFQIRFLFRIHHFC